MLRAERGISQIQLAKRLFVDRSTISRWESGSRLPDNMMIARISKSLDADINILLNAAAESDEFPNVIMVDDTKIILKGGIPVLEAVMPNAVITGACGFMKKPLTPEGVREQLKRLRYPFLSGEFGTCDYNSNGLL